MIIAAAGSLVTTKRPNPDETSAPVFLAKAAYVLSTFNKSFEGQKSVFPRLAATSDSPSTRKQHPGRVDVRGKNRSLRPQSLTVLISTGMSLVPKSDPQNLYHQSSSKPIYPSAINIAKIQFTLDHVERVSRKLAERISRGSHEEY